MKEFFLFQLCQNPIISCAHQVLEQKYVFYYSYRIMHFESPPRSHLGPNEREEPEARGPQAAGLVAVAGRPGHVAAALQLAEGLGDHVPEIREKALQFPLRNPREKRGQDKGSPREEEAQYIV